VCLLDAMGEDHDQAGIDHDVLSHVKVIAAQNEHSLLACGIVCVKRMPVGFRIYPSHLECVDTRSCRRFYGWSVASPAN